MMPNPRELARQAYLAASGQEPTTETLDRMADEVLALLQAGSAESTPQLGERSPITSPLDAPEGIPVVEEYTTTSEVFSQALAWDVADDRTDDFGPSWADGQEAAPGVSWDDVEEALVGFGQSAESSRFLEQLRGIAAAASPGPWRREGDEVVHTAEADPHAPTEEQRREHTEAIARLVRGSDKRAEQAERDAEFLTTFDPSMVLALLFLNRQLVLENARLRRGIGEASTVDVDPPASST